MFISMSIHSHKMIKNTQNAGVLTKQMYNTSDIPFNWFILCTICGAAEKEQVIEIIQVYFTAYMIVIQYDF